MHATAFTVAPVPLLDTARLHLRQYRMSDFDGFAAHMADPGTTNVPRGCDRRTAWRIFGWHTGMWLLLGAGWWAVEMRESGEVVGTVGAFFREGSADIELGWNTYRKFWGRGFAAEAAAEMVRYAIDVRREKRVTALIDARNLASIRVAAKVGLTHESDTELFGEPVGRYVLAPQLVASRS